MTDRTWDHWYAGISSDLQTTAMSTLLEDHGEDYILTRFFETYGLMEEHHRRLGTVAAQVAVMPPEPTSFVCDEHAQDALSFLDMVRSPEPPSFPLADLPTVADACLGRARAYLELARSISAGKLTFPKSPDRERAGQA